MLASHSNDRVRASTSRAQVHTKAHKYAHSPARRHPCTRTLVRLLLCTLACASALTHARSRMHACGPQARTHAHTRNDARTHSRPRLAIRGGMRDCHRKHTHVNARPCARACANALTRSSADVLLRSRMHAITHEHASERTCTREGLYKRARMRTSSAHAHACLLTRACTRRTRACVRTRGQSLPDDTSGKFWRVETYA
eukprot:1889624-Pleurochrysis_carterae.AAC.2